jgi:hypothetical protein
MNGKLPYRENREPLGTLHSVRRIEPGEQSARRAVERALAAVRPESRRFSRHHWKRIIMRSSLAAAVLVVVVTTGWLVTSGPDAIAAPTWADLGRQTKGIDRVYLEVRAYQGEQLVQRADIWIKSPGIIRNRNYELSEGKMIATEGGIATPKAAARWDERTKLGEHTSTNNRYMMQSGAASTIEAMLGISLLAERPEASIQINGEQVRFEPVAAKHPEDASLRGYKVTYKAPTSQPMPPPFTSLVYWFAERSNTLCRLTMEMGEGSQPQRSDVIVDFEPKVPADWFEVKLPADCIDVSAGVGSRLPSDVKDVYDNVTAARKRFGDYRAVIWRDATGGWPMFREAARGEQWRCDTIDWTVMHGAMYSKDNPRHYVKIGPEDSFAKLWQQVTRFDYDLESTDMTWQGKYALLHYKLGGRGPRTSAELCEAFTGGHERYIGPSLRMTAWPEWMWWENLQPHGWDLRTPALKWRLGPADASHPEHVQVIGERDKGAYTRIEYTFDRTKDWLCVEQLWEANEDDQMHWMVTECGQTADGFWYPRKVSFRNSKCEYAVERGAAGSAFFAYPQSMPAPVDAFGQFQSRADQAATASAPDVPATARGKYTAIGARGLPRGFDDKARSEAHSQMVRNMVNICHTLNDCAYKHKWVFPERLQEMVDEGFLRPEDLKNPLHPDADPPFGYIRPNMKLVNRLERMVLYEPFKEWPGVVAVVFQDGSIEYIHDKAQFDKLVQEATRPEPPSRESP